MLQSTDSDLSWDDEEVKNAVTFTDFIQQYNELMEWLNQIQMFTQRQGSSLSEKYLNQVSDGVLIVAPPLGLVFLVSK